MTEWFGRQQEETSVNAKRSTDPKITRGPKATYETITQLRAEYAEALATVTSDAGRRYLKRAIETLDEASKTLKTKTIRKKKHAASRLNEIDTLTDRGRIMARLARKIGLGCYAIYHGTRHLPEVLRTGKLVPPLTGETAVFLSRSPEAAAYFASFLGSEADHFSAGVLVLNRRSLIQSYRLDPSRYDEESDQDEREEVIWNRIVNIRRHLLGVVSDADVTSILGSPKHRYLPPKFLSWSLARRSAFNRSAYRAGDRLVRKGRARVREIIIRERKHLSMENARLPIAPPVEQASLPNEPPRKSRRRSK
jgi:hypothetical protein